MSRKLVLITFLIFALVCSLSAVSQVQSVEANGTIYIRADGSIEGTTHISTADNITYIFTNNISDSIVIERDNIVVDGANYTLQGEGGIGIRVSGRSNVTIKNMIIKAFYDGIYLTESNNVTISNNTLTDNYYRAIDLWYTNNSKMINNNIIRNYYGVSLWHSSSNVMINNTIAFNNANGVWMFYSRNATFRNNKIAGNSYNFAVGGTYLSDYVHDVDSSNTVEGKPMYYWVNKQNRQIPTDAGYVAVINSTEIVVRDLILRNNSDGIVFAFTNNSTIMNVTITNGDSGIFLYNSRNNTIVRNTIMNHRPQVGFGFGITLAYSNNNEIYHNDFANNMVQVRVGVESPNNSWDDGYPSGGNYWSDYNGTDFYIGPYQNLTGSDGIGDTPYIIDEANADRYPLMSLYGPDLIPPITISDYDGLWHNVDFAITLTATDIGGTVAETYYKINNGPLKKVSIDGQPSINTENADDKLEYWSIDSNGNEEIPHNILTNIKLDKTDPYIALISGPSNETEVRVSTVTIEWSGLDELSDIDRYEVAIDGSWINAERNTAHAFSGVSDGCHTIEVKAFDNAGNTRTISLLFTINTSPIGGPGYIEEYAIVITLIGVAIGITTYILKFRKKLQMKKHYLPTRREGAVLLIGVSMVVFVYVASIFVIQPFFQLSFLEGYESSYSSLEPGEEKIIFIQPRPSDFNYSLGFTVTADNPVEITVVFNDEEIFRENATHLATDWQMQKELSGGLHKMGYLSIKVRSLSHESAFLSYSVNLVTYYRESTFISFAFFSLGLIMIVGGAGYSVYRILKERKMQQLEVKREAEHRCGTCFWFGKPKCKRKEESPKAKPCEDYM